MHLDLGPGADIVILTSDGCMLSIRYVSVNTFLHGIRVGTLYSSLMYLSEISQWAYLIIRDSLAPGVAGKTLHDGASVAWPWTSVVGAMLSVQEMGIGTCNIRDYSMLDDCLIALARRDRSQRRIKPPREVLWSLPAEDVLLALPGIGDDKADALLSHCGSAAWALTALTAPESVLPKGIGPETCHKAREALGLQPDQYLSVLTKDD